MEEATGEASSKDRQCALTGGLPWSWTLPLQLHSPGRGSASVPPSECMQAMEVEDASFRSPRDGSPCSCGRDSSPALERSQTGEGSLGLAFLPPEQWPERFLLDAEGPVSWSWTLPLALASPRREEDERCQEDARIGEATAEAQVAHHWLRSPHCSARGSGSVAGSDGIEPNTPTAVTRCRRLLCFAQSPPLPLQVTDAIAPIPWSWTLPLDVQSPRDTLCGPSAEVYAVRSGGCSDLDTSSTSAADVCLSTPGKLTSSTPGSAVRSRMLLRLRGARGDAPRILELVLEAELQAGGDKQFLAEVYVASVDSYGPVPEPPPADFCDLCVKCLRILCQADPVEAREFHNRLRVSSVGRSEARLYEARASLEEGLGNRAKAVKVLQEGLRVGARPPGILRRTLARLELACQQRSSASTGSRRESPTGSWATASSGHSAPGGEKRASAPAAPSSAAGGRQSPSPRGRKSPRRDGTVPAEAAHVQASAGAPLRRTSSGSCGTAPSEVLSAPAPSDLGPDPALLQRQVWELQLENQRLRQEAQQWQNKDDALNQSINVRQCPRCCREAVGGAVAALLEETVRAVDHAFPASARDGDCVMSPNWREQVAEEVWALISSNTSVSPTSSPGGIAPRLPALMPLRAQLQLAAASIQSTSSAQDTVVIAQGTCRKVFAELAPHSYNTGAGEQLAKPGRSGPWNRPIKHKIGLTPPKAAAIFHALAKENAHSAAAVSMARHTSCLETVPTTATSDKGPLRFPR